MRADYILGILLFVVAWVGDVNARGRAGSTGRARAPGPAPTMSPSKRKPYGDDTYCKTLSGTNTTDNCVKCLKGGCDFCSSIDLYGAPRCFNGNFSNLAGGQCKGDWIYTYESNNAGARCSGDESADVVGIIVGVLIAFCCCSCCAAAIFFRARAKNDPLKVHADYQPDQYQMQHMQQMQQPQQQWGAQVQMQPYPTQAPAYYPMQGPGQYPMQQMPAGQMHPPQQQQWGAPPAQMQQPYPGHAQPYGEILHAQVVHAVPVGQQQMYVNK